jgi:hypothetical protein
MTEEIPEQLGRERECKIKKKCGNEERENGYWIGGDERRCRMQKVFSQ